MHVVNFVYWLWTIFCIVAADCYFGRHPLALAFENDYLVVSRVRALSTLYSGCWLLMIRHYIVIYNSQVSPCKWVYNDCQLTVHDCKSPTHLTPQPLYSHYRLKLWTNAISADLWIFFCNFFLQYRDACIARMRVVNFAAGQVKFLKSQLSARYVLCSVKRL